MTNPWVLAILCAAAFLSGWMTNGWRHDSIDLAAEKAANKVQIDYRLRESAIANVVEDQLQDVRIHERTTIEKMQPIIQREVYKIECIDDDGLAIINGMLPTGSHESETGTAVTTEGVP